MRKPKPRRKPRTKWHKASKIPAEALVILRSKIAQMPKVKYV